MAGVSWIFSMASDPHFDRTASRSVPAGTVPNGWCSRGRRLVVSAMARRSALRAGTSARRSISIAGRGGEGGDLEVVARAGSLLGGDDDDEEEEALWSLKARRIRVVGWGCKRMEFWLFGGG